MADYNLNDVIKLFGQVTKRNGSAVNARDIDLNEDGQISTVEIRKAARAFGVNLANFFLDVDPAAIQTDTDGWDKVSLTFSAENLVNGLNTFISEKQKEVNDLNGKYTDIDFLSVKANQDARNAYINFGQKYYELSNSKILREYTEDDNVFKDCVSPDDIANKIKDIKGEMITKIDELKTLYNQLITAMGVTETSSENETGKTTQNETETKRASELAIVRWENLRTNYSLKTTQTIGYGTNFTPVFMDGRKHDFEVYSSDSKLCKIDGASNGIVHMTLYPAEKAGKNTVNLTIKIGDSVFYVPPIEITTTETRQVADSSNLKVSDWGDDIKPSYTMTVGGEGKTGNFDIKFDDGKTHEYTIEAANDGGLITINGNSFTIKPLAKDSTICATLKLMVDGKLVGEKNITIVTYGIRTVDWGNIQTTVEAKKGDDCAEDSFKITISPSHQSPTITCTPANLVSSFMYNTVSGEVYIKYVGYDDFPEGKTQDTVTLTLTTCAQTFTQEVIIKKVDTNGQTTNNRRIPVSDEDLKDNFKKSCDEIKKDRQACLKQATTWAKNYNLADNEYSNTLSIQFIGFGNVVYRLISNYNESIQNLSGRELEAEINKADEEIKAEFQQFKDVYATLQDYVEQLEQPSQESQKLPKAAISGECSFVTQVGGGNSTQRLSFIWSDGQEHNDIVVKSRNSKYVEIVHYDTTGVEFTVKPGAKSGSTSRVILTIEMNGALVGKTTIVVKTE